MTSPWAKPGLTPGAVWSAEAGSVAATTAMRLGSCLGQAWPRWHNAFGVGGPCLPISCPSGSSCLNPATLHPVLLGGCIAARALLNNLCGSRCHVGIGRRTGVQVMSTTEVILRLGLVSLLGIYLLHRHWRRVPAAAPRPEDPSWWTGHGIDTRQLRPALGSVRDGYRNATRTTCSATEGARRLAVARAMVSCLGYFRTRQAAEVREEASG